MLNSIKSEFFLRMIAEHLIAKTKLKLFKINKVLLTKLKINEKDFKKYYSENVLVKYDSKRLKGKLIDDFIFELLDLTKVEIKDDDSILNLSDNKIENLKPLVKEKFPYKYDFLYLGNNLISNIDVFEKDDFKNLLRLVLSMNKISDISVLERAKFTALKSLNLSNNKISDIRVFGRANLKKLNELYLHGNLISNITPLQNFKFEYLGILDLSKNKIADISAFKNLTNFWHLKNLNLSKNQITNVNTFINWIENYSDMIETEEIVEEEKKLKNPRKILGNLAILDLSQNKLLLNNDIKNIQAYEEIIELKDERTVILIDIDKYI